MIAAQARICRNPKVAYRDLEEGGVLLHLESGNYHGLNDTGSLIWKLLEGEPTMSQLLEELRTHLEHPPSNLADEMVVFLDGLRERNLITV